MLDLLYVLVIRFPNISEYATLQHLPHKEVPNVIPHFQEIEEKTKTVTAGNVKRRYLKQ